jgi:hypothetical protein
MNNHLRAGTLLAALLLTPALAIPALVVSAPVATAAPTPCAPGVPVAGDFNGDGAPDLAVSVDTNWEDASTIFVSPSRTSSGSWLDLGEQAFGDHVLTSADLDGDQCADAIISSRSQFVLVRGTSAGLAMADRTPLVLPVPSGRGAYCQAGGFGHDNLHQVVVACSTYEGAAEDIQPFFYIFTLDASGGPGTPQVIDGAAQGSDMDWPSMVRADGRAVVVGSQSESVQVLTPDTAEPSVLVFRHTLTQSTPGIAGTRGDHDFGQSLALRDGYLAIGAPMETVGVARHVGRVHLLVWDATTLSFTPVRTISQDSTGIPGTNESGDYFGSTLAIGHGLTATGSVDLVIGTPGENVGAIRDAGAVSVSSLTGRRNLTYTQNSRGVPGTAEKRNSMGIMSGELFGSGIGILPTSATTDTLAIGAPGETNKGCLNQGYLVLSDGRALGSSTKWTSLKPPTEGCSYYDGDVFYGWGASFAN